MISSSILQHHKGLASRQKPLAVAHFPPPLLLEHRFEPSKACRTHRGADVFHYHSRYWLPSILKHKHVALHFLPQSAYERAAPLDVSPKPDVVTRVFMLFKGVDNHALDHWSVAKAKAAEDVNWWRNVVGVDLDRAMDASLFRVLEWGGMEVPH
ncbi:hypothetical protein NLJ89_g10833 [Agrocybe chaxingu]|uniref:Uncharacterized protein n=1 Tax=Agrocybe chaxingu TaxID=84603 RepID=A0A9W8JPZ9_9AGAR|nr:hypothetical protein NLJ89_g10833 [Agrocybe chaxingu]